MNSNMKRKLLYIIGGFLLTVATGSCVDMDRYPLDELSDGSFWKKPADAEDAVTDLYNTLPDEEVDDAINSDDAVHGIKWAAGNISRGVYDPGDFGWKDLYGGIRRANLVFTKIGNISNYPEAEKNKVLGQAHFFRAMLYFQLIRNFGDVPYTESPLELKDQKQIERTPRAEVYKHVMADLDKAIAFLPEKWTGSNNGRITKGAALALKARAALYYKEWSTAADAAKKVIDSSVYDLYDKENTGKYAELFWEKTENCEEVILARQYKANDKSRYLIGWECFPTLGWGGINPTQSLVDAFEDIHGAPIAKSKVYDPKNPFANRDPRLEVNVLHDGEEMYGVTIKVSPLKSCAPTGIAQHGDATATGYYQQKWLDPAIHPEKQGWNMGKDAVIIRYAEVLLTYAEALNETSPLDDKAFEAVNKVRSRVGMPPLQKTNAALPTYCATQDDLRKRIWNERRVELAMEGGHRQWDIRRWGIAKTVLNAPFEGLAYELVNSDKALPGDDGKICILYQGKRLKLAGSKYEDHNYVYPIPQSERDLNKKLTQNTGYPQ